MKKILLLLFVVSLFVLAGCGGKSTDKLVQEVVDPAPTPSMGEAIQFAMNEEIFLTNNVDIISVRYLGSNEFGKEEWTCVSFSNQDCAERHGEDTDMVFYLNSARIGETSGSSAKFATYWKVVKGE